MEEEEEAAMMKRKSALERWERSRKANEGRRFKDRVEIEKFGECCSCYEDHVSAQCIAACEVAWQETLLAVIL